MPILLAAFAVGQHVHDAQRIYETVFVVVLASVVVQGGTILAARASASRCGGYALTRRGDIA